MSKTPDFIEQEFRYLEKRIDIQFQYLKEVRHLIDPRVSDNEIMKLRDMEIDAVSACAEKIKELDKQRNSKNS
jgi:hypothetical protein